MEIEFTQLCISIKCCNVRTFYSFSDLIIHAPSLPIEEMGHGGCMILAVHAHLSNEGQNLQGYFIMKPTCQFKTQNNKLGSWKRICQG